jgi:predicted dithiol-disulfide oxidoreductase (DUF899 family)
VRRALGTSERVTRRLRAETPYRDRGDDELVGRSRGGRERPGIEQGERAFCLVDAPDQEEAPDPEIPRMRGIDAIAVLFERHARRVERLRIEAQVARHERNLGLGNDAPRSGHGLLRTERPRGAAQERLRANEVAKLRHRDPSQRKRGRVVAQRDTLQRAERIARGKRMRGGSDQRVHWNPVTSNPVPLHQIPPHLSLPSFEVPALRLSHGQRPRGRCETRAHAIGTKETRAMATHTIGTRDEWLKARLDLLTAEKDLTRRGDEVARQRQELPWVRLDKEYRFDTDEGTATLKDLFKGRSQLLTYHFMFGPDYRAGCPSCSAIADGFNGSVVHLANHDVTLMAVSRAPLAKLQAYKQRMGWTFPWASSFVSDFNFDFNVSFTEEDQRDGLEYNYRRLSPKAASAPVTQVAEGPVARMAAGVGVDVPTYTRERPGMSTFVLEDGVVYHAYSTYSRGVDAIWGMFQWLDRAPKGRNETDLWWRRKDEYGKADV